MKVSEREKQIREYYLHVAYPFDPFVVSNVYSEVRIARYVASLLQLIASMKVASTIVVRSSSCWLLTFPRL